MNVKAQGEWIRGTYRVIKAFPFVIGTLYYAEMKVPGRGVHTRFIHALDKMALVGEIDPEAVQDRDEAVFFPVREAFVEEDVLYQVFRRLEGTLFAHRLEHHSPFSLKEAVEIARKITVQLLRLYDQDQFTLVHPQNMVLTSGGALRFLYGGRFGILPKGAGVMPVRDDEGRRRDQLYDSYTLGVLIYRMLTGKNPMAAGLKVPPISRFCPHCPRELDELVERALSFDPDKRPGINETADFLDWLAGRIEGVEGKER
jgi:serine/threonine protein kinase